MVEVKEICDSHGSVINRLLAGLWEVIDDKQEQIPPGNQVNHGQQ